MRAGERLAAMLAGSWREETPPGDGDLGPILEHGLAGGVAGLLWWRHRFALPPGRMRRVLRRRFRSQAIDVDLCREEVGRLGRALRRAGVPFVLAKGLAACGFYPRVGMRPCGDIDIYVAPNAAERAREVARRLRAARPHVPALIGRFMFDVHVGIAELGEESFSAVLSRVRLEPVCGVPVLSPEDHLRLLCLHGLRHGLARPLWLSDVAAASEALPPEFDRERLLGREPETSRRVRAVLEASRLLLGAEPPALPGTKVPRWFIPAMLRQWSLPYRPRVPMRYVLRRPARLPRELAQRWPNGIEATEGLRAPFDDGPRVPYQLGECVRRLIRFAKSS